MVNKTAVAVIFPALLLLAGTICAQTSTPDVFAWLQSRTYGQGSIVIKQNSDIRDMMNLHLSQQHRINGIRGYKISIYSGGSGKETRKDAELVRSKFLSKYENIKCELLFEYPNWKVYVGSFRTKSEALRFLERISNDYPDEPFIREGIVAYPD